MLIIEFDGFKIGRVVSARVNDPVQTQLMPTVPYQGTNARSRYQESQHVQSATWVVPGRQLIRSFRLIAASPLLFLDNKS